ncbi:dihydroorotase [Pseudomonas aeruginosa MH38]|nr:dihydroorotase [Pseudomonas aeruginosa MH38]
MRKACMPMTPSPKAIGSEVQHDPQESLRRPAGDRRIGLCGQDRDHLRQGDHPGQRLRRSLRSDPCRRSRRRRRHATDRDRRQLEHPGRRGDPFQVGCRGDHRRAQLHRPPLHRPRSLRSRRPGLHRLQQRAVQLPGRRWLRGPPQRGGRRLRPASGFLRTVHRAHRSAHRPGEHAAGQRFRQRVLGRRGAHQRRPGTRLQVAAERVLNMQSLLIRNARMVNEGQVREGDLLVRHGRIERIAGCLENCGASREIDAAGRYLLPGMIDDQVHFREPGYPQKGSIASESRAAVAGGITSFMDMPNTRPATLSLEALAEKKRLAAAHSVANFGFHFGVSRDNLDTVAALDPREVAAVKVFMGASTGDMLVDDLPTLERLFASVPTLLLSHCEDTPRIEANLARWRQRFGERIPAAAHPRIRDAEACYRSTALAVELAQRHGTLLHVLHLSTARELALFEDKPLCQKRITAEVCVHHLLFDDSDYARLGHLLKCNPAIKSREDRDALRRALAGNRLDVIGTDHAPHAWAEKQQAYPQAPAGLPLVQHALPALLELVREGWLSLATLVAKTSHRVAELFAIADRGFLREGYWADLVLVSELEHPALASAMPLLSRCNWTPFRHRAFHHRIDTTIVSGQLAWHAGRLSDDCQGLPLRFSR